MQQNVVSIPPQKSPGEICAQLRNYSALNFMSFVSIIKIFNSLTNIIFDFQFENQNTNIYIIFPAFLNQFVIET